MRRVKKPTCEHERVVAVAAECNGVRVSAALVCCSCGGCRAYSVRLCRWLDWSTPLSADETFPEGAALTILAGPSTDTEKLEPVAICCEEELQVLRLERMKKNRSNIDVRSE